MIETCEQILLKVESIERSDFFANDDRQLAVTHLLQIVGEAARQVSKETREAHPEIVWRSITSMRHKIVHDYFDVDFDIVWDTARNDINVLLGQLRAISFDESSQ